MAKDTPAPDAPKTTDERLPVEELARLTGNVLANAEKYELIINGQRPLPLFTWQHAAAAQLHGWNQHKLDSADPLLLTHAEYEAALKVVEAPVARVVGKDGQKGRRLGAGEKLTEGESLSQDYEPHDAALSPFAPKGDR